MKWAERVRQNGKCGTAARRGLGDWVELQLESIGITQERYMAFKQAAGLPPRCNCAQRKEYLNKLISWNEGGNL